MSVTLSGTVCCTTSSGEHTPDHISASAYRPSTPASIRQVDANGKRLPFDTVFPDRWSNLNDGSSYEPCTALSDGELEALGLDQQSVTDGANANMQTSRGCDWRYRDSSTAVVSQGVGNDLPLEDYKKKYSTAIEWQYDTSMQGRPVAVGYPRFQDACTTAVQSGSAIVTTTAILFINPPPRDQVCAKAIAFTKATIDKMPP
nr:DUF3558 family protein [Gordonia oryzae]